jgi:O-antigen/teichoic acid export membrane protein
MIAKKTVWQMWVSIASAAFGVAANFLLIGFFGIVGAAFATLACSLAFFGLWFGLSQRLYFLPVRWGAIALASGVAAGAGVLGLVVRYPDLLTTLCVKAGLILVAGGTVLATKLFPFRKAVSAANGLAARFLSLARTN